MPKRVLRRPLAMLLAAMMVWCLLPVIDRQDGRALALYTPPTALEIIWPGTDQSATCHDLGDYITNVTLSQSGTPILNNSSDYSLSGGAWHTDYGRTNPQVTPGEVKQGETYQISVTVNGTELSYHYLAVYIDWNQNNRNGVPSGPEVLDDGEQVAVWFDYVGSGITTQTASFTVPADAPVGQIYMRVMLDADSGLSDGGSYACAVGYGEFEDYVLQVVSSNAAPVATNVQLTGTLQVGDTLTGSYTYSDSESDAEGASLFKWYRADDASGTNKAQIPGAAATAYTLQQADIGKYISFEVTPVAAAGASTGVAVESTALGKVMMPFYIGNALHFADADDRLYINTPLTTKTDNITMETWVKADTISAADTYIRIMYNGNSSNSGYGIYLAGSSKAVAILVGGLAVIGPATPVTLNNGQWYHLAAVRDNGAWKLYVNGEEKALVNYTAPNIPTQQFSVGNSYFNNENFTGCIDETRFWTVARTQQQIKDHMYIKLSGKETGLLAYYNYDQGTPAGNNTSITEVANAVSGGANLTLSGFSLNGAASNFVQSVQLGTFALSSDSYTANETMGTASVTIARTGGSEGSATIKYATHDGTAKAGTHYTNTAGSVTFASGETSKTVNIPIIENHTGGNLDFSITLSAPQGVALGANASAAIHVSPNAAPAASNVQITGTVQLGQTLTGSYTYSDSDSDPQGTGTFKWYRSNDGSGNGKTAIAGADTPTYTVQKADLGKYLSFEVTPVASAGASPGAAVESGLLLIPAPMVTVNYDAEGGSITPASQTKLYGSTYGKASNGTTDEAMPTATRTGHNFGGWWTGDNGTGSQVTDGTVVTDPATHTLYAKWSLSSYAVTYQPGTHGALAGSGSESVLYGSSPISVPGITVDAGYTFSGWSSDGGTTLLTEAQVEATVVTAPITYTACYSHNSYTVTYQAGAHGALAGSGSETVLYGNSPVSVPGITEDEGYTFTGWSNDGGTTLLTKAQVEAAAITGAVTYTAYYSHNSYTVTYLAGAHGTLIGSGGETVYHGDSPVSVPTVSEDEGYVFTGWSADGGTTLLSRAQVAASVVTGAITYTAQYEHLSYTVTYQAGAHGSFTGSGSETVYHGDSPVSVPDITEDEGYTFTGWSSDGGTTLLTEDQVEATVVTAPITYTAYYTHNSYTVTYQAGAHGSLVGSGSETVYHGSSPVSVPDVSADVDYVFTGWSSDGGATLLTKAQVAATVVTAPITYTAYYRMLTYEIDAIGNQTFTALVEGYGPGTQQTKTIPITRAGTGDLKNLAVALGGADAGSFIITQPPITVLDADTPTTAFTVKAKDGLPMGTYTAQVTVSASSMTNVTFTVTQVVSESPAAKRNITFVVSDGTGTIPGASITVGGVTKTTDSDGKAVCLLANGTYAFSISKAGYTGVSGNVAVSSGVSAICLVMVPVGQVVLPDEDGSTDAVLIADEDDLPEAVILVVDEETPDSDDTNAVEEHYSDYHIASLFDIYLLLGTDRVQPGAAVTVGIPIPASLQGKPLLVVRINDDGTITEFETKQSGDMLFFTTDHFSRYAILNANEENPDTGDKQAGFPVIALVIGVSIFVAAGIAYWRRKRRA